MSWQLWIPGNQTDPKAGNPIPWSAMTQRGKRNPSARRYIAYKQYIQMLWLERFGKAPAFDSRRIHRLDVHCVFRVTKKVMGKCSHADSTNCRKGVEDAIFGKFTGSDDQHVWGLTTIDHSTGPGVLVNIFGTEDHQPAPPGGV